MQFKRCILLALVPLVIAAVCFGPGRIDFELGTVLTPKQDSNTTGGRERRQIPGGLGGGAIPDPTGTLKLITALSTAVGKGIDTLNTVAKTINTGMDILNKVAGAVDTGVNTVIIVHDIAQKALPMIENSNKIEKKFGPMVAQTLQGKHLRCVLSDMKCLLTHNAQSCS